jgi:aminoglycoside phosphotransferase (APT) family kinase protein
MSGDANALDQTELAPYLEAHIPGFAGLHSIEKFKSGQSNPTYLLTAASGRYVLRTKPPGQLLKSAHQVDREFTVMKALAGTAACSTSWISSTAASSGIRQCRKPAATMSAPPSTTP